VGFDLSGALGRFPTRTARSLVVRPIPLEQLLGSIVSQAGDRVMSSAKHVIGPDGSPLTIADLPAPGTKRWVIRRKAEVVAAVSGGLLSLEEACRRYTLTVDEFRSWQESIDQYGLGALRATRIQRYRPGHRRRP
jgi:Protein of unknown function (DUF1153)